MKIKQALVLAGGKGTRMYPVTLATPKPLVCIYGRPLLDYLISQLKNTGVEEVLVSIGYKAEQVKDYFGDGTRFGLKIEYLIEDVPLGTGGPLLVAQDKLDDNFYMVNADEFTTLDLTMQAEQHAKNKDAIGTIFLHKVADITGFGVIETKNGKVTRFLEKPSEYETSSQLINGGRYVLSKKILKYVSNKKPLSIERDIFPKLAEEGKLYGYQSPYPVFWHAVNTIDALKELELMFSKGRLNWPVIDKTIKC